MKRRYGPLVLCAAVVAAVAGCETGEAANQGPTIQTAEVERGDLSIRVEANGQVEPIRQVEVKSKASGEILELSADVGDEVRPGALLARIDPRDVQNRYDQAKADLEVAVARSDISRAQLDRSDQLLAAGVITQQEHENARLDYANAQAQLVKAKTNYDLAELQLNDVSIRAPMAGTIIQKNVEEGVVIQSASQNVSGGTTLFVMANLAEMQVRTLVDETDMGQVRAGMPTTVTVEAFPDRTFRGTVLKIEPLATVEQNVTMFPVIVTLDNSSGLLKPGMNAEVEILVDEAIDVVLVPNNAIVQATEVGPAALALGLDVDQLDLTQFMRGGRGGGRPAAAQGGGESGAPGGATRESAEGARNAPAGGAPAGAPGGDAAARLQELRAQVESGAISQDSMRAIMRSMGGARGAGGAGRGFFGATAEAAASGQRQSRPAVVFVMNAAGTPEPRAVRIGLNDWDRTQVVEGIEPGDVLAVVGAAQLQAQQQEWLNRIRSRAGGSPFGGGPGGGPRGGR